MLLEHMSNNLSIGYSASNLAKTLKLNQKTVSNHLHKLEKQHLLRSKLQGKNRLFYFNFAQRNLLKNFILEIEAKKSVQFINKHPKFESLIKDLNAQNILIFGSYANNTYNKKSDLDIYIVGSFNEKIRDDLEMMYDLKINIIDHKKSIFRKGLQAKHNLLAEIVHNHIILKGFE
ncbi:nucleotidyltransferase domain-containing protein, partial [Nanoarchaeota archaeon]